MSRRITCIQCPMGCVMNVGFAENGEVTSVEGNSCGRGKKYAQAEANNPVRTVCGTVCASGDVICENVCGTGVSLVATKSVG